MHSFFKEYSKEKYTGRKKTEWFEFGLNQLMKMHQHYGFPADHEFQQKLLGLAKYLALPKNTTIIDYEQPTNFMMFLISGSAIEYGKIGNYERVEMLYTSGSIITSYSDFLMEQPSSVKIKTLEPSRVLYFSRAAFKEVVADDSSGAFKLFVARFFQEALVLRRNIAELQYYQNKTKLEFVYKNYPIIFSIFSLKNIAAFLGMEPETISRMRAKIK